MDDLFKPELFRALLKEYGFSDEDIEQNWQKYLEAAFVLSIDDYLKSLPEADRDLIIGSDDLQTPEGLSNVKNRFLEYYQQHKSEYKPFLNQLNFATKIKAYIDGNNG